MKSLFSKIAALSLAGALALGAQAATADTPTVLVDNRFEVTGVTFGQAYGTVLMVYSVRELGGQTVLCGVTMHEKPQTLRFRRKVLRKGWLKAGGKKILRDLSFFEEAGVFKEGDPLDGAAAGCAPLPASARAPYELGFDRISIRP
ncbi:hypothetical protein [Salipiger abyssi]|uniref:hypothetical protein n=1 Tax=Salipiger abyssi TaxID=1250539 RepID=UPI001A9058D3|nr:hypothetical protein [Salipiger abyssi]MBN9887702.1 hypothetical protein [Salipiger abyssi]